MTISRLISVDHTCLHNRITMSPAQTEHTATYAEILEFAYELAEKVPVASPLELRCELMS